MLKEGLLRAKPRKDAEIDYMNVLTLQEMHVANNEQAHCYKIYSYKLATTLPHVKYGLVIYVKDETTNYITIPTTEHRGTATSAIKIGELTVINIYKPPNVEWPNPALLSATPPSI